MLLGVVTANVCCLIFKILFDFLIKLICFFQKGLKPIYEEVASELKGKVKVGALDATVHQTQSTKYSVQGFPTIKG